MTANIGADAVTDKAVLVLSDRPVVPLGPGLLEKITARGRVVQLVTSPDSRVTLPLRTELEDGRVHWVVAGDGYYDGLTGRPLRWDGAAFTPDPSARDYAPDFTSEPRMPPGTPLTLTVRTPRTPSSPPGLALAALTRLVTGAPPLGFGTSEPLTRRWEPSALRGAESARVLVVGSGPRPALGSLTWTDDTETSTLTIGHTPSDPPPLAHLPWLAATLTAEHPLTSFDAHLTPTAADLTTEPRWTGTPSTVAIAG
ncbi:DUF6177 family protein [Actinomadura flavalba]|uniref:DUF6177 family protein n=1 Tax=Actinomadura flavalba TaxID=1120938 RepID=UPI0003A2BC8B|nr:DUF6177 family protein [Actinomadura flavalba]